MLKSSIADKRTSDPATVTEPEDGAPEKLIKRIGPDRSQSWRRLAKVLYLALNI
jgi:hypothetical protein